jgi:hypothetical protein
MLRRPNFEAQLFRPAAQGRAAANIDCERSAARRMSRTHKNRFHQPLRVYSSTSDHFQTRQLDKRRTGDIWNT